MDREQPILSIASLRDAFAKADEVTLSKFEIDAIMEVIDPALDAKSELAMAKLEIKRIRKVAAPVWKASERVSKSLARYRGQATEEKVREWKFLLDNAGVVYWSDLPQRLRRGGRNSRACDLSASELTRFLLHGICGYARSCQRTDNHFLQASLPYASE